MFIVYFIQTITETVRTRWSRAAHTGEK